MKKQENLKAMLKDRLAMIDKQLDLFEPKDHLTFAEFEAFVDDNFKPVTVSEYAFMPSKVLFQCNLDGYYEMFNKWAGRVDKKSMKEYQQLLDEREQTLDWLGEIQ
jgi:hypothetical protein